MTELQWLVSESDNCPHTPWKKTTRAYYICYITYCLSSDEGTLLLNTGPSETEDSMATMQTVSCTVWTVITLQSCSSHAQRVSCSTTKSLQLAAPPKSVSQWFVHTFASNRCGAFVFSEADKNCMGRSTDEDKACVGGEHEMYVDGTSLTLHLWKLAALALSILILLLSNNKQLVTPDQVRL